MAFSSCFKKIEVVEVEGFSNVELNLKGIKSDLIVNIYNPNPLSFTIESADILLSVGDVIAGDLVLEESVKLSSKDTTSVTLKLVSRKGAIGKIMVDNFTNALSGGEVLFKAEGEIMSSTFGLKRRLPIRHEEVLEL
jgi:LEA14-like dessication related protein